MKQFVFQKDLMQIKAQSKTREQNIFSDPAGYDRLRQLIYNMQVMSLDPQTVYKKETEFLTPLKQKWGLSPDTVPATSEQIQERPKVGKRISPELLDYLVSAIGDIQNLF